MRLTPAHLHILLSAAAGPIHGYAIKQQVEERTRGGVKLGPGSLYWAINKLADAGLLEEAEAPTEQSDGPSRRYYAVTAAGRARLAQELEVLTDIVHLAASQGLTDRPHEA